MCVMCNDSMTILYTSNDILSNDNDMINAI